MSAFVSVRQERQDDIPAIHDVNTRAFSGETEAGLVDALRTNGAAMLSLVATVERRIVGHILFSPAVVGTVAGAALAPMAVLPDYQRQGIGSALVETGNRMLKERGCPFVIVLGHIHFYPRFGFRPASAHGITCEWPVPDAAFMLLVLDEPKMRAVSGLVKYRAEFSSVV